ncbi:MAG: hypothetical protein IKM31_06160 [Oscillospiraceae bacterium]|nr:hypothetical protein [Oscillospiraceae bacterium]
MAIFTTKHFAQTADFFAREAIDAKSGTFFRDPIVQTAENFPWQLFPPVPPPCTSKNGPGKRGFADFSLQNEHFVV